MYGFPAAADPSRKGSPLFSIRRILALQRDIQQSNDARTPEACRRHDARGSGIPKGFQRCRRRLQKRQAEFQTEHPPFGAAKHAFERQHPCPSTGKTSGRCPGYVVDHVKPLECGGADAPGNMQWQTIAEGKAKDKTERLCR